MRCWTTRAYPKQCGISCADMRAHVRRLTKNVTQTRDYLGRTWSRRVHKLASFGRQGLMTLGNSSTNRAESMNAAIRLLTTRYTPLSEFYRDITSLEEYHASKRSDADGALGTQPSSAPYFAEVSAVLAPAARDRVLHQITSAVTVAVIDVRDDGVVVVRTVGVRGAHMRGTASHIERVNVKLIGNVQPLRARRRDVQLQLAGRHGVPMQTRYCGAPAGQSAHLCDIAHSSALEPRDRRQ